MKRLIEAAIVALMIYVIFAAAFTPIAVARCYAERGCFVVGGEWMLLVTIPLALIAVAGLYKGAVG